MGKKARERREQYERRAAEARREQIRSGGTYWDYLASVIRIPDERERDPVHVYLDILGTANVIKTVNYNYIPVLHDKRDWPDFPHWPDENNVFEDAISGVLVDEIKTPLRPPFEATFIEWDAPRLELGGGQSYIPYVGKYGVLVVPDWSQDDIDNEDIEFLWLTCVVFDHLLFGGDQPGNGIYYWNVFLDKGFSLLGIQTNRRAFPNLSHFFISCTYHVLKTLEFLNCRNIVLVDNEPDAEASREYERHFGRPLTKYKTLGVKSFSRKYDRDYEGNPYQGIMPLHIRRGHFATYTEDAPLFGKYTGTFWRPATVVGEQDNGIVVKDYEVKP